MAECRPRFVGSDTHAHAQRLHQQPGRAISKSLHVRGLSEDGGRISINGTNRHLKPGYGWLEHVEIDFTPRCDDGTLPPNSATAYWASELIRASTIAYRPLSYNEDTRRMLEYQGFVEISEQVIKAPLNPWPTDPHMKDMGRWLCLSMMRALEGMSLALLTRTEQRAYSKDDVTRLCKDVEREMCAKQIHMYFNL